VIVEINPPRAAAMGMAADGAWQMLRALGYRLHEITASGEIRVLASSLSDHPINVIALP
jgi:hypothetical protein